MTEPDAQVRVVLVTAPNAEVAEGLARALVEATAGARKIVMYSSFERRCIRDLQRAVPALEGELRSWKPSSLTSSR